MLSFTRLKKLVASAKPQEFSWRKVQDEFMSIELPEIGVMVPLHLEVYVYVMIKLCAQRVTSAPCMTYYA